MTVKGPSWHGMESWWREELASDPAYDDEVTPLILELGRLEGRILDVGCGEGRLMNAIGRRGSRPVGIDVLPGLLISARPYGDVVRGELPDLSMFGDSVFDGAVVSLVLEHIDDHARLFEELARTVRRNGELVLVVNHPVFTAPDSAPIQDSDEVLWRTGRYLDVGYTDEPSAGRVVRFHHRPMHVLLGDASSAGWDLRKMTELGVSRAQVDRSPILGLQRHIPRLLGCRWTRR